MGGQAMWGVPRGNIVVLEYGNYIGIMEKKMEATT